MNINRSGFTLLELIIVLFLITLILGLSSMFFANTLSSGRFNASAREMAATMRQARHLAQLNGKRQVITINMDSGSYMIEGRSKKILPPGIHIKVIDPLSGEISKGEYKMSFHVTGNTWGGTVLLWNKAKVVQINVDPVAGAVIIK